MVSKIQVDNYKTWFKEYYSGFKTKDNAFNNILELKFQHSLRVCREIIDIGKYCDLPQNQLRLAETMALFHDLGRFQQYKDYKTFSDKKSIDHAELAVQILKKYNILSNIEEKYRLLIYKAIENHNKIKIPFNTFGDELFFSKLLRDADKVDIFKVVTNYYENKHLYNDKTLELDLPDTPEIKEENYIDIVSGRTIKSENLKTLNDFKLMQISWLFDINFTRSFQKINENGYIQKIFATLPQHEKIMNIKSNVLKYISESLVA